VVRELKLRKVTYAKLSARLPALKFEKRREA
jgi:hypothetical protein